MKENGIFVLRDSSFVKVLGAKSQSFEHGLRHLLALLIVVMSRRNDDLMILTYKALARPSSPSDLRRQFAALPYHRSCRNSTASGTENTWARR